MTFLVPLGLLSLLALPLIALLHMIQRRRPQRWVPSVQFWTAVNVPVQRKRRRLPLTLLLLLHLIVAALIGLALSWPRLPGASFQPSNTVIVLDTSTSMATQDVSSTGETRFAAAQRTAREILESAQTGDHIGLVVLGTTPRLIGEGGPEAAGTLASIINQLQPAGHDGDLATGLSLAAAVVEPQGQEQRDRRIVVLTDEAFATSATSSIPLTVTGTLQWRTFGGAADNVAIVAFAAQPLRTGVQQLYARVANFGDGPATRQIDVLVDGKVVQTEPVRLDGNAEAEWSWPLPRGARQVEARLTPHDQAPMDDTAAAMLTSAASMRVALISPAATPLERALRAQPGVELTPISPDAYQPSANFDLAVFVGYTPEQLPPIPTLLVAPPIQNSLIQVSGYQHDLRADPTSQNDPLRQAFAAIDLTSVVFPRVATINIPSWATPVLEANDVPLILTGISDRIPRAIWTFDPATSNLQGRLAFPLLTAATIRTLIPQTGSTLLLGDLASETLVAADGTELPTGSVMTTPGIYRWTSHDGGIAVNMLDAGESDLRQREAPAIEAVQPVVAAQQQIGDRLLWRILLAAALIVLMLEWLYTHRRRMRRRIAQPPAGLNPGGRTV